MREGTVEVSDAFRIVCEVCGSSDTAVESRDQQMLTTANPLFTRGTFEAAHPDKIRFSFDVHLVCNGCNTSSQIWSTVTPPVAMAERHRS